MNKQGCGLARKGHGETVIVFRFLQWRCRGGGASGSTRLGAKALGAHKLTFCNYLKTRFKQKFRPKYAKKCVFFGKNVKIATASADPYHQIAVRGWRIRPQTLALFLRPTITTGLNAFYYSLISLSKLDYSSTWIRVINRSFTFCQ